MTKDNNETLDAVETLIIQVDDLAWQARNVKDLLRRDLHRHDPEAHNVSVNPESLRRPGAANAAERSRAARFLIRDMLDAAPQLTLKRVAEMCQCKSSTPGRWLKGKMDPSEDSLARLVAVHDAVIDAAQKGGE